MNGRTDIDVIDSATDIIRLYQHRTPDFYARQMTGKGLRAAWFRMRQETVGRLVREYYRQGPIVDICCGNCLWHDGGAPVVGVDICDSMLRYNRRSQESFSPVHADITQQLPFRSASVDMVVVSEVLEHFPDNDAIIHEIGRILRPGGVVISSVPFGRLPGLWGLLFPLWCVYKAWKDDDDYYRNQCGHKVKFSAACLRRAFQGFDVLRLFSRWQLTLFCVARRS